MITSGMCGICGYDEYGRPVTDTILPLVTCRLCKNVVVTSGVSVVDIHQTTHAFHRDCYCKVVSASGCPIGFTEQLIKNNFKSIVNIDL